jgi:hypothetical protein
VIDSEVEYQNVVHELGDARKLVRKCLERDERCRNDDLWLLLKVWAEFGVVVMVDFQKFKEMPCFETVRRVRQEIQSTAHGLPGEFLPTDPDILIRRKVREDAMRAYYGNHSRIIQEFEVRRYGIR